MESFIHRCIKIYINIPSQMNLAFKNWFLPAWNQLPYNKLQHKYCRSRHCYSKLQCGCQFVSLMICAKHRTFNSIWGFYVMEKHIPRIYCGKSLIWWWMQPCHAFSNPIWLPLLYFSKCLVNFGSVINNLPRFWWVILSNGSFEMSKSLMMLMSKWCYKELPGGVDGKISQWSKAILSHESGVCH